MTKQTPHTVDANGTERKQCSKCKEWKALGEYHTDRDKKDGLRTICKVCTIKKQIIYKKNNKKKVAACTHRHYEENKEKIKAYQRKYRERNKEKIGARNRKYRKDNKVSLAAKKRKYCEENKEKIAAKNRKYRESNKEKIKVTRRKWRKKNREIIAAKRRESESKRRKEDPLYSLSKNIRRRLNISLKKAKVKKVKRSFKFISCSPSFLLERLEKMRVERGLTEYHIDHMRPLASFDLKNTEELRRCWHWSNLQALDPKENLRKNKQLLYDMKWAGDEWVIRTQEGNGLYRPTALFRSLMLV